MLTNLITNIAGAVAGLIFIFLSVKAGRSLVGSFFKRSYNRLAIGATAFTVSFLFEIASFFGLNDDVADATHHILLLVTGVIFIFVSLIFTKEATEYMNSKEKTQ
ncbi:MAG: hypothetical protein D4Q79_01725 [Spirochaetia bacterium]|nr:MAG: hypothetical protein D4Q79_01725 [Spirochaetia bacterium]